MLRRRASIDALQVEAQPVVADGDDQPARQGAVSWRGSGKARLALAGQSADANIDLLAQPQHRVQIEPEAVAVTPQARGQTIVIGEEAAHRPRRRLDHHDRRARRPACGQGRAQQDPRRVAGQQQAPFDGRHRQVVHPDHRRQQPRDPRPLALRHTAGVDAFDIALDHRDAQGRAVLKPLRRNHHPPQDMARASVIRLQRARRRKDLGHLDRSSDQPRLQLGQRRRIRRAAVHDHIGQGDVERLGPQGRGRAAALRQQDRRPGLGRLRRIGRRRDLAGGLGHHLRRDRPARQQHRSRNPSPAHPKGPPAAHYHDQPPSRVLSFGKDD
ncbi:hypothetical protein D3C85_935820 [compost metagenome]